MLVPDFRAPLAVLTNLYKTGLLKVKMSLSDVYARRDCPFGLMVTPALPIECENKESRAALRIFLKSYWISEKELPSE